MTASVGWFGGRHRRALASPESIPDSASRYPSALYAAVDRRCPFQSCGKAGRIGREDRDRLLRQKRGGD